MESSTIPATHHVERSYGKVIFVCVLFLLCLISFVAQTELTSYLYTLGYNEPFLLLYLTHGSWWMIWPLQVCSIAIYKSFLRYKKLKKAFSSKSFPEEQQDLILPADSVPSTDEITPGSCERRRKLPKKWKGFKHAFKSSIINQHRNIFHTSEIVYELNDPNYIIGNDISISHFKLFIHSEPIHYVLKTSLWIMILLNFLGSSWYFALTLTTSSDVTLIYNCSAFSAYAFAIIFLKEKFSILKLSSVVFAIIGVVIVTYSGNDSGGGEVKPYRLVGNLIILVGALLYGLYEVVYKKYLCPPANTVSSRRQALFSSFSMSIIGFMTALVLWIPLALAHIFGIHKFQFPDSLSMWGIVIGSILSNVTFSVAFLSMISLTSPVLSSVASLVTILFVGIAEWYIFHIGLSFLQMFGDVMVAIGFLVLTMASWNEVSEEDADDTATDIESVYSATQI